MELGRFDFEKGVVTRLTDTKGENILSDWSPDGKTIAFTGKRIFGWRIYLFDLSTSKIKALTDRGNCRPRWSQDGQWIAYVSSKEKHDIFLMRSDGSGPDSLTNDPDHQDYFPNWSRDGKRIYFAKSETLKKRPWHIWVINSDGSQPFQITYGNSHDKYPDVY